VNDVNGWLEESGANRMEQFRAQLNDLSYAELRGIATRLGVRTRGQERKEAWVAVVVAFWQTPAQHEPFLTALSPAAQAALVLLRTAQQLPTALFLADHGALRRPGEQTAGEPPPWQAPATVSEELYYSGLLHPVEKTAIARSSHVAAPAFVDELIGQVNTMETEGTDEPDAWPLLHDLAAYLIYRHQHGDLRPLHGRWLSPTHMAALNRRLLQPDAEPLPRSHKAAPRLCFLAFLGEMAGLVTPHGLTALGWQWLADAPAAQLMTLWQAWQRSSHQLRQRHGQADGALPTPWPQPLVRALAQQPGPFTPLALAAQLLGESDELWRYYVAHLADSQALAHVVADLLAETLTGLGVVEGVARSEGTGEGADPAPPLQLHYRCTATGVWLLHPVLRPPLLRPPGASPPGLGTWLDVNDAPPGASGTEPRPALSVWVDASASFAAAARLAVFADHVALAREETPRHVYRVTRETVARAAADGHPFHELEAAYGALSMGLEPAQLATLWRWYTEGRRLRLAHLLVLRSTDGDAMAALWQDRRLRPLFGELLSPTTATLTSDVDEAAPALRRAGHWIARPASATVTAGAAATADDVDETEGLVAGDAATLWLAGQLYWALGEHLSLPAPLPSAVMDRLWQQIDPRRRAQLQSQRDVLLERLTSVLDGYALTPPVPDPNATDAETWRAPITAAIAAGRSLTLRYYTAARNLLTERTVDPYWIEERHGIAYLQAYCHNAERVLVFRLDRIQGVDDERRTTNDE